MNREENRVVINAMHKASEIARSEIIENRPGGLRLKDREKLEACRRESIEKITKVLATVPAGNELAQYAAEAVYRSHLAEHHLSYVLDLVDDLVASADVAHDGASGNAENARRALQKLQEVRGSIVTKAVEHGVAIGAKIKAAAGAAKRQSKRDPVKVFAISLFESKSWKSIRQAACAIQDEVLAKARKQGWTMAEDGSFDSIYRWLLKHKNSRGQPRK